MMQDHACQVRSEIPGVLQSSGGGLEVQLEAKQIVAERC